MVAWLLWLLYISGLLPALYFLVTNRPSQPGLITFLTHGFPVAVVLTYLRAMTLLAIRGGPSTRGGADTVTSLLSLLLVDVVINATAVAWVRYRTAYERATKSLAEDERRRTAELDARSAEQDRRGVEQDIRGAAQDRRDSPRRDTCI